MYGSTVNNGKASAASSSFTNARSETPGISLFPQPQHPAGREEKLFLRKEVGLISSTAVILNLVLGSGIFITPSGILQHTGSFGLSLCLWIVGGAIALLGSTCYLELALLIKKSGGTYIFIKEAYSFGRPKPWLEGVSSFCGFVVAWTNMIIVQPLSHAILLLTLGRYMCRPFFIGCGELPMVAVKMFALSVSTLLMLVNAYSVKISVGLLNLLSFLKVVLLFSVIVLGFWKLIQHGFPGDSRRLFEGSITSPSEIALGLYGVIWAYSGWDAGIMLQEETRKAKKNLVQSIFIAIPVVAVLFILINVSFFSVLSYNQILNTKEVGLAFGYALFGDPGMVMVCAMVVILLLGATHGNLMFGSREMFVCSREGSMPRFISGLHTTFRTPICAIVVESLIASVLVLIGDIDKLLNAFNALNWATYGAGFMGLIIMRLTEPDKPRPFKVLLLLPSVMVVVSVLLVCVPLWQDPLPQLLAFAASSLSLPLYCAFIMETPCKLRPKVVDRFSLWLVRVTSKLFNSELSCA